MRYIFFLLLLPFVGYGQMTTITPNLILQSYPDRINPNAFTSMGTADAAGESITVIGRVFLQNGTGSKTISAGSGSIRYRTHTGVTWANASSNLRIGIQDVNGSGVEDGTFDVYADLVPGTEAQASSTYYTQTMESGTKTISQGDLIAISFELTARAGSDAWTMSCITTVNGSFAVPYLTNDTGSGPSKSANGSAGNGLTIIFDDGTLGWVNFLWQGVTGISTLATYGSSSSPDEYAACFRLKTKAETTGAAIMLGAIASTDNFDIVLYSDPFGTPSVIETINYDADLVGSTATGMVNVFFATPRTLAANTWYAIAVQPTTTNTISMSVYNLTSGFENFKSSSQFGLDCKVAGRTNQTGAFTETFNYHLPFFDLYISKLDKGNKEHSSAF